MSYGRHFAPPPPGARRAAVMALLYPVDGVWHMPFTVRPTTMTDHAGQVSLPGGLIEPGESTSEAALRELAEELGVDDPRMELLGELSPLYLFVSNFQVTPWVGVLHERPTLVPNEHEVAEVLEVPLPYMTDPTNIGRHARDHRGIEFSAPHLLFGGHCIWGATGMILGEFIALADELSAAAAA
ncbi:MAG: CoA pyrophosphatase [Pirellulales bacterium]|nr:CoA pyrophosphatase [Pirellulales bacterium]